MSLSFKELIDAHHTITILSHINPDADAIGTSLGIYALLKAYGKQVEVVNYSEDLPQYLDFLPNFFRIKQQIDYKESLVISCDCGSIDRLGFELSHRVIVNIDHHQTNKLYGTLNLVDASLCAASHVAYREMVRDFPITAEAATCFYTALLSDTQNFSTSDVDREVFSFAMVLMGHGANHTQVTFNLGSRRSLCSVRILSKALEGLALHDNATIASIMVDDEMIATTGARMSDMVGIVDVASSLVTVEVALLLIVQGDEVKVSLRSKTRDLTPVAQYFGGGGHPNACGFSLQSSNLEELLGKILHKLKELG